MDKLSKNDIYAPLLEIVKTLANEEHLEAFISNMKHLDVQDQTLFEWWETYLAWSEVGSAEDMEEFYG